MPDLSENSFALARSHMLKTMPVPSFCVFFDDLFRAYLGIITYINSTDTSKRFLFVIHVEPLVLDEPSPVFDFQEDKFYGIVVENHYFYYEPTQQ